MCFHSAEPCSLWQRAKKAELKWWCHELNTEVVLKLTVIPSALYCQHCHLHPRDPETQRKTKTNFSQGKRWNHWGAITLNNLTTTQNIAIIPSLSYQVIDSLSCTPSFWKILICYLAESHKRSLMSLLYLLIKYEATASTMNIINSIHVYKWLQYEQG